MGAGHWMKLGLVRHCRKPICPLPLGSHFGTLLLIPTLFVAVLFLAFHESRAPLVGNTCRNPAAGKVETCIFVIQRLQHPATPKETFYVIAGAMNSS
jgi:hypothetical protein